MNTIEIKNLKDKVLFTHTSENNTIQKTLEKAVHDGTDLRDASLRYTDLTDAGFRGAKYTPRQTDLAFTEETTKF